jgi:gluconate 2-dehydrogenase alpha chain
MVGKYIMSHHYQVVAGFFDDTVTNPSVGPVGAATTIDEFNGDNFDHTGLGFIEGASITGGYGNTQAIVGASSLAPANFQGVSGNTQWGTGYKDFLKKYWRRQTSMIAQLPSLPYEANFLDLDPNVKDSLGLPVIRITYDGYDNEKKAGAFLQDKMETILKKMGASAVRHGPTTIPPFNNHEVGPCRMGDDPARSVVNRYLQSHELGNMFVVSGAVFPTYFGYNPTHTIEALGYWSADYIKNQTKGGGSLTKYM